MNENFVKVIVPRSMAMLVKENILKKKLTWHRKDGKGPNRTLKSSKELQPKLYKIIC